MGTDKKIKYCVNMLSSKEDTVSGVVDIDGQISVIDNYSTPERANSKLREDMLIDRAFHLQGKERPSNDD